MRNKYLITVLVIFVTLTFILMTCNNENTEHTFLYISENGEITITGYEGPGGDVTIPARIDGKPVTAIGNWPFQDCVSITGITIPDSVKSIGYKAFGGCSKLTRINIPFGVTSIEDWTFTNCSSLTSTTIPDSVTIIKYHAFDGCSGLTSITIPDSVIEIGTFVFLDCSRLTSITIPDSVTVIGYGAFWCSSLTSVTIGNGITSIGEDSFSELSKLTSVTIGNNVESIGDQAFWNCPALETITIPESVTSIGSEAFRYCTGLTSVTFKGTMTEENFSIFYSFPGDLRRKYFIDGIGTYTTKKPGNLAVWTHENATGEEEYEQYPEIWSWTEGAFSLTIDQSSESPLQTGDSFELSLLGYGTIMGTIQLKSESRASARAAMPIAKPGGGGIIFLPPGGESFEGDLNGGTIYIDDTLPFPDEDKDFKAPVAPDGMLTDVTLPEPVDNNEIGGKVFNKGLALSWVFDANNNYILQGNSASFDEEGNFLESNYAYDLESGKYSVSDDRKTIFLLPEKIGERGPWREMNLIPRDEWLLYREMEAYVDGMTDTKVFQMTGGKYKTVNEYLIARANNEFGLKVYDYEIKNGSITQFTRRIATTLDHNENGRRIGGLSYNRIATDIFNNDKHYSLSSRNFIDVQAQLNTFLGSMSFDTNYYPADLAHSSNIGDIVLVEGSAYYSLLQCVEVVNKYVRWEGIYWSRLNF